MTMQQDPSYVNASTAFPDLAYMRQNDADTGRRNDSEQEKSSKTLDHINRKRLQNRIAQRNYRRNIKRRIEDLEQRAAAAGNLPQKSKENTGTRSPQEADGTIKAQHSSVSTKDQDTIMTQSLPNFVPESMPTTDYLPPRNYQPTTLPYQDGNTKLQHASESAKDQETLMRQSLPNFVPESMPSTNYLPPRNYQSTTLPYQSENQSSASQMPAMWQQAQWSPKEKQSLNQQSKTETSPELHLQRGYLSQMQDMSPENEVLDSPTRNDQRKSDDHPSPTNSTSWHHLTSEMTNDMLAGRDNLLDSSLPWLLTNEATMTPCTPQRETMPNFTLSESPRHRIPAPSMPSSLPKQNHLPSSHSSSANSEPSRNAFPNSRPKLPSHANIDERFDYILDCIRASGFDNFDAVVSAYYTGNFGEASVVHNAQKVSRNRRLPDVLIDLRRDVGHWTHWEAHGYEDQIVRSAESILVAEFDRFMESNSAKELIAATDTRIDNIGTSNPPSMDALSAANPDSKKMLKNELPNLLALMAALTTDNSGLGQQVRSRMVLSATTILCSSMGKF